MPTHKKGHDKDKYYHLAKDHGYRSRAAFKLIQINKRFDFLTKARVVIDLCAAPGGWCQVAAQTMPQGSLILGIDLLPIRAIRNVKTLVQDITTAECRKLVAQELQGWKADVVLCDGAPNIGAAYAKDAYVQNELVLAALKTATDHLVEGGTFCTKVYRSTDYNSLIWVFQQLFEDVQAMKPNSSRSQSSEIFIICLKYLKPNYIDPKLLDPNHVFKEVKDPGLAKVDVMHKKYEKLNKRHRTGYDEELGPLLRATASVSAFVNSKDPIRMLTDVNEFIFTPDCKAFLEHKLTTEEMKMCFKDLRVLGKSDFKRILRWRQHMRKTMDASTAGASADDAAEDGGSVVSTSSKRKKGEPLTETEIQEELEAMRLKASQLERKEKKKKRELAAKERLRQSLGMNANAFGEEMDEELFQLNDKVKLSDLAALTDVNLNEADLDDIGGAEIYGYGPSDEQEESSTIILGDEDLEAQLEQDYVRYITRRKTHNEKMMKEELMMHKAGVETDPELRDTKTTKKLKKDRTSDAILDRERLEDEKAMASADGDDIGGTLRKEKNRKNGVVKADLEAYVQLLTGKGGAEGKSNNNSKKRRGKDDDDDDQIDEIEVESSDDSDDDDDEDEEQDDDDEVDDDDENEEEEEDEDEEEEEEVVDKLLVSRGKKAANKRVDEWFSHPIFKENLVEKSSSSSSDKKKGRQESLADEMINAMPKTDREVRKEKRKKEEEKRQRKLNNRSSEVTEEERTGFEVMPRAGVDEMERKKSSRKGADASLGELDENSLKKRRLIKEGMGGGLVDTNDTTGFEVVPKETVHSLLERKDDRTYDSDEEDYDAHDRAMTLALGTLMLRKSRQKALVDASYNRFAWNDSKDLPSWFVDDEQRHNKPQVPIPPALLEQIKSKYQFTGTKEIKKVAEAKMRKRKRAANKLKAAKKQANSMAENSEMSEKQKLRAISKAMRGSKVDKPGKVYVVTKKTGGASSGTTVGGGKGKLKFVDKRMKKDQRATRAKNKRDKKRKR